VGSAPWARANRSARVLEEPALALQGIPKMLYLDNGPIGKSRGFRNVMACLDVRLLTHMPAGGDRGRATARAKGKVERLFRTVKEAHERLYHFHTPPLGLRRGHQLLTRQHQSPPVRLASVGSHSLGSTIPRTVKGCLTCGGVNSSGCRLAFMQCSLRAFIVSMGPSHSAVSCAGCIL
jgi:hypothetical protein